MTGGSGSRFVFRRVGVGRVGVNVCFWEGRGQSLFFVSGPTKKTNKRLAPTRPDLDSASTNKRSSAVSGGQGIVPRWGIDDRSSLTRGGRSHTGPTRQRGSPQGLAANGEDPRSRVGPVSEPSAAERLRNGQPPIGDLGMIPVPPPEHVLQPATTSRHQPW